MELLMCIIMLGIFGVTAFLCMCELATKWVVWVMGIIALSSLVIAYLTYGKPVQGVFFSLAMASGICTMILHTCRDDRKY
jgi:hypothetical protein